MGEGLPVRSEVLLGGVTLVDVSLGVTSWRTDRRKSECLVHGGEATANERGTEGRGGASWPPDQTEV